MSKLVNLLDYDREALHQFFVQLGEKSYRAEQVMRWVYQNCCDDFDSMSDLNYLLRAKLKDMAVIATPKIVIEQPSSDGTIKWAMQVGQDQQIETVYIPEKNRGTLCVSSQVGCSLSCSFCSTAQQGFNRNLRTSEIIGQVWRALQRLNQLKLNDRRSITNVVFMGMGEPLLNLANVVPAIKIMLDDFGYGLSKRRVTISTAGVVPALDKLSELVDVSLAISLHAPEDQLRSQLIPLNCRYNIEQLLAAVQRYLRKNKANQRKVTIEYIMLHGVNDSIKQARQLALCLHKVPSKINLIPWNSVPNLPYQCSTEDNIAKFAQILTSYGFVVTKRRTRGREIAAACGQLTGKVPDRTKRNCLANSN